MAYLLLTPVPVSSVGEVEVGFYRLWKASGKGGDNWYCSLGSKQAAVFNPQMHKRETRQVYVHPYAKTDIHTQFPSCVVSEAKLLFPFCTQCFYLSALYHSPLIMKASM